MKAEANTNNYIKNIKARPSFIKSEGWAG